MTAATTTPTDKAGEPVAWLMEDLILPGETITRDGEYARRKAEYRYEGEPTTRVTPLYTTPQPLAVGLDRETVARCIIGPRRPVPMTSPHTLEDLRDINWSNAEASDKADALNAADAILALAAPAEGWLGIETAPKDGTAVLGCWTFPDRTPLFGVVSWGEAPHDDTWAGSEEGWREGESCVVGITHWMPLPAAPTGGRS